MMLPYPAFLSLFLHAYLLTYGVSLSFSAYLGIHSWSVWPRLVSATFTFSFTLSLSRSFQFKYWQSLVEKAFT